MIHRFPLHTIMCSAQLKLSMLPDSCGCAVLGVLAVQAKKKQKGAAGGAAGDGEGSGDGSGSDGEGQAAAVPEQQDLD